MTKIKANFDEKDIEKLKIGLSITLTLGEWREVAKTIELGPYYSQLHDIQLGIEKTIEIFEQEYKTEINGI